MGSLARRRRGGEPAGPSGDFWAGRLGPGAASVAAAEVGRTPAGVEHVHEPVACDTARRARRWAGALRRDRGASACASGSNHPAGNGSFGTRRKLSRSGGGGWRAPRGTGAGQVVVVQPAPGDDQRLLEQVVHVRRRTHERPRVRGHHAGVLAGEDLEDPVPGRALGTAPHGDPPRRRRGGRGRPLSVAQPRGTSGRIWRLCRDSGLCCPLGRPREARGFRTASCGADPESALPDGKEKSA
jgi:hypothetical protein